MMDSEHRIHIGHYQDIGFLLKQDKMPLEGLNSGVM